MDELIAIFRKYNGRPHLGPAHPPPYGSEPPSPDGPDQARLFESKTFHGPHLPQLLELLCSPDFCTHFKPFSDHVYSIFVLFDLF